MGFRVNHRRWIAAVLLGAYGCAGVLGYGLHALWPCDHCYVNEHSHHVAHASGHCHHHHHGCDHHGHQALIAADDCPICAFLAQAQSERTHEPPVISTAISPADPLTSELSELPNLVRLHLARGPPLV